MLRAFVFAWWCCLLRDCSWRLFTVSRRSVDTAFQHCSNVFNGSGVDLASTVFLCQGQKHGEHFKRVHRLSSPICLWSWMARACQLWQVLEFIQASPHSRILLRTTDGKRINTEITCMQFSLIPVILLNGRSKLLIVQFFLIKYCMSDFHTEHLRCVSNEQMFL